MSFLGHLSSTHLQGLMGLPWDSWENFWSLAPLLVRWQPHPYPLPKFNLGDRIAEDWFDEYDTQVTDYGEIRGLCYLPEPDFDCPENTWVYFVYWTHTSTGSDSCYPCFDSTPTDGKNWRLVKKF